MTPPSKAESRKPLAALLALCGAAYLNSLPGILFWDNEILILKNVFLRSFRYIPQILTTSLFAGAGESTNYYRPVSVLILLLQYQLWGEAPLGYHAASIVLHLAATALLYALARRLLGSPRAALAAAAFFALHPIQNETVNYVDHQEGMLALIFGLCAILLRERGRLFPSLFCAALCLLSKEEGLTLFLALGLCASGERGKTGAWEPAPPSWRLTGLWPYAALVAVYIALRLSVFNFLNLPIGHFGAQKGAYAALGKRLLTFAEALTTYFRLLLLPTGLHFDRDMEPVRKVLDPRAWASVGLDAAVLAGLWRAAPWPGRLGLLWFLAALLPFCGLVPFNNILAEHFLYIPMAGLSLTAASLWERWRPLRPAAPLLLGIWLAQDLSRNRDWTDASRLYRSTLAGNPKSYRAANNLGVEQFRAGDLGGARASFEAALRTRADYAPALNNVGAVIENRGDPAEALEWYRRSARADPTYVQAHKNSAGAFLHLGNYREAVSAAEAALALHPHYADALEVLGSAHFRLREYPKAVEAFERAAAIRPGRASYHNLSLAYRALGQGSRADETARLAETFP